MLLLWRSQAFRRRLGVPIRVVTAGLAGLAAFAFVVNFAHLVDENSDFDAEYVRAVVLNDSAVVAKFQAQAWWLVNNSDELALAQRLWLRSLDGGGEKERRHALEIQARLIDVSGQPCVAARVQRRAAWPAPSNGTFRRAARYLALCGPPPLQNASVVESVDGRLHVRIAAQLTSPHGVVLFAKATSKKGDGVLRLVLPPGDVGDDVNIDIDRPAGLVAGAHLEVLFAGPALAEFADGTPLAQWQPRRWSADDLP
jgi:hypothetical protein